MRFEIITAFVIGALAQVESTLHATATEPHNLVVVLVKLLLWSVSMVSLVLSFRSATRTRELV